MEKGDKEIKMFGCGNPEMLAEMVKPLMETCKEHGIIDAKITIIVDPNVDDDDEADTEASDKEPAFDPKSNEWSKDEKFVMCQMIPKERLLAFELEPVTCANGAVEYLYKVEPNHVRAALMACREPKKLLGLSEIPDLHSRKLVTVDELRILRYKGRNLVVSPYYAESGGMLVDLIDRDDLREDGTIVREVEGV